jgi:ABC-2 type transport system permease protein
VSAVTGTRELVKLASRRDRIMLPLWAYALIGSAASTAYSIKGLYADESSRQTFAAAISSAPAAAALYGKILGTSLGAITAWRSAVIGAVLASVMSILLVTRHTRAEEQSGRQELVSAGAVGPNAPLAAALQISISVNISAGVVIGAVLPFLGLPAAGAFALGLSIAGCGVVFTALSAVTAQLSESSRTANGIAFALLGFFYLVRAAGDMSSGSWLLWCSPLGWTEQVRAYSGDRWWVLALSAVASVLLIALAVYLSRLRDYGSGVLPARPGPEYAAADTRGVFGLAWRVHRASLAGWTFGMLVGALAFGAFAKDVNVLSTSGRVQNIMAELGGTRNLSNAYLASIMGLFGILAGAYAVSVIARARAEEADGRLEVVLAGAIGRTRWILSHVLFAVAGTAVLLAAAGFGAGLSDGLRTHDVGNALGRLFGAAFAQWPAVLVIAALAAVLLGALPAYVGAGWGLLALFGFLTLIGPTLKFSQPILDVSPFNQVPKLPGVAFTATPLLWLCVAAAAALAATLAAFRRRDLTT